MNQRDKQIADAHSQYYTAPEDDDFIECCECGESIYEPDGDFLQFDGGCFCRSCCEKLNI